MPLLFTHASYWIIFLRFRIHVWSYKREIIIIIHCNNNNNLISCKLLNWLLIVNNNTSFYTRNNDLFLQDCWLWALLNFFATYNLIIYFFFTNTLWVVMIYFINVFFFVNCMQMLNHYNSICKFLPVNIIKQNKTKQIISNSFIFHSFSFFFSLAV